MSRPLSALLIAFAMLFAPVAMAGGGAMVATPPAADHHAQMQDDGHCGGEPAKSQGPADDGACCVAACTGLALEPAIAAEPPLTTVAARHPSPDSLRRSFLAELPTPPPRIA